MFGDCVVSVRSSRRGFIFAAVLLMCVASAGYAQPGVDALLSAQVGGNGEAARLLQAPDGAVDFGDAGRGIPDVDPGPDPLGEPIQQPLQTSNRGQRDDADGRQGRGGDGRGHRSDSSRTHVLWQAISDR